MNDLLNKVQQICRICLLENQLMFSVLHRSCTNQTLLDMIMSCTSVKIELDDNLPQLVCSSCVERLETAYSFKLECERSDETLRKLLYENEDIDNKDIKSENLQNLSTKDSDCDDIPLSMLKIEMKIDENELDLKNEPSEEECETRILRKRITKRKTKKRIKTSSLDSKVNKRYNCVVCNKTFRHHQRYWAHTKEHPNYTCYICWKRFGSIELLDEHNKDHPSQLYICDEFNCDEEYDNYRLFLMHKKNDHMMENYLQCMECDNKNFSSHEQWDIHIQKHVRSRCFPCKICSKTFCQKTSLANHLKIHEECFKCNQCDRSYTNAEKLEKHKQSHETCFVCDECGKKYNQKYNLKKHIDHTHRGIRNPRTVKQHLCPHCGQTFARPIDLTIHIRLHTGVKPFSCDQCEYRCHDKQLLKSHERIHTGLKPFQCDICGKSFSSRSYLTIHKRFHTGYRPYKCTHCPKGFTNSKDLKVHERTHTGIKLYHCNICNNSFTTLHYLKVHIKKHESQ